MAIKISFKIYKSKRLIFYSLIIILILVAGYFLISYSISNIIDSKGEEFSIIPVYHVVLSIFTVLILILFFYLPVRSHIRKIAPHLNSIADKILNKDTNSEANMGNPGDANDSDRFIKAIDLEELIKKIDIIIANHFNAISEMGGIVSNLRKSIESNSEVLSFLSNKAEEHTIVAEKDLVSIQSISDMTNDIVDGAEDQHVSLGLLVVRMLDFTKIIESISKELTEQVEIIDRISEKFEAGNMYLMLMYESMNKINESSGKMSESLKFITEISDKINLLSLNAAIESARAGEYGRGFAVVSDEISKLADQTASSINEVNNLIKINEHEIKNGLSNVEKTVDAISSVVEGVVSVKEMMHAAYGKMDFQIKNNYIVNEESEKVKKGTNVIMSAITKQKDAIDNLVISLKDFREMSQYVSYLTKQVVKHALDISEGIEKINKHYPE